MKIKLTTWMISFIFLTCCVTLSSAQTFKEPDPMNNPIIVFETNQGNIEIELFPEIAPKACENIAGLIDQGYYDGTVFHRVIKGFMIQGGDPTATGRGGQSLWGSPFADETTPEVGFDQKGLLAMANAGPKTNGSQFFITTTDNASWLNGKHTIFGKVISGYATVEKIENAQTDSRDKPVEKQTILRAYIKNQ